MSAAKRLDVAEKIIHAVLCDGHIRRVNTCDGYVRKLWRIGPSWDTPRMAGVRIDLQRVVEVLREVTSSGRFTQRGLSKAAHEGRDCVRDIISGRNKNPTIKVLSNLASAMDADLSVFGLVADSHSHDGNGTFDMGDFNERTLAPIVYEILRAGKRSRALNAEPLATGLADYLRRLASDPAILTNEDALAAAAREAISPDSGAKPKA